MESELSTIVPTKLLNSFSVIRNFLEVSQDINKYGFQYKKHLSGIVSQAYKSLWRGRGSLVLIIVIKIQFLKNSNCLSPGGSK